MTESRIAVLIPCYNEALTIASVVTEFRKALPQAVIYVYDNNSRDDTCSIAAQAGAVVRSETRQGKGHVVRRMFSDIDSDIYVLVDGDATYDGMSAAKMIDLLVRENLAMVVGRRVHQSGGAYRPGHVWGNRMFTRLVEAIFGATFTDILSGYRVFSRAFVKSFPISGGGFEIETELTVHALVLRLPASEIETIYRERPTGSTSKLNTYRDGWRIIWTIIRLFRNERPSAFFSYIGAAAIVLALILAYPIVKTFLEVGTVPRFPTAILATGLVLAGIISFASGIILEAVTLSRKEIRMLAYLAAKDASAGRDRSVAINASSQA